MATIDNRVVSMSFDNAAFERRLAQTVSSLEKLERSLQLQNSNRGLQELQSASRNFNLTGLSSSIEGVSTKFLALSTIGITVLSNLTSRAVDAGISIGRSLSLDQVLSGFREYELNIGSIQTILANTKADGTNLEQVNAALDELNTFADKTIFNFAEMTRNIGTFTAAGVDLETSTQSIKGIANLAAISGSNSNQAATAMYQLSQAISTGSLKLQDWNSVVNAGLGGEVFQTALFETGKALGTIADTPIDQTFEQWQDAGNTFRNSLQDGWITAEVLTTTLQGFTGDLTDAQILALGYTEDQIAQIRELGETGVEAATKVRTFTQLVDTVQEAIGSGWSQTFRIILGDFEEATELFSGLSDAISAMAGANADARNELLSGWDELGGRTLVLETLKNAFEGLGAILAPIREAFREVFPPTTSQQLFELTQRFSDFVERMQPSERTIENIRRIFTGFFSSLEIGWEVIREGTSFVSDLFQQFTGAGNGGFLSFLADIGDRLTNLNSVMVDGGGIAAFFDQLRDIAADPVGFLQDVGEQLRIFAEKVKEAITSFSFDDFDFETPDILSGRIERLEERFESLQELGANIGDIWGPFREKLSAVGEELDKVGQEIKDWFKNLGNEMAAASEPGDFDAVLDALNLGLLGVIGAFLGKIAVGGVDFDFGGGLIENISDTFEELTDVLGAMQAEIRANALLKIAGAIGILTLSVGFLATMDSAALSRSLTAMSVGFGQLLAAFAILTKIAVGPKSAASFGIVAGGLILLSGALALMSVAVRSLAGLDWEELARGLTGMVVILGALSLAVKPLSANSSGMITAGIGIAFIAGAMNLLALAVRQFAGMEWEELAKGLAATAAGLAAIVLAVNLLPENMLAKGAGISLIAAGLNLLASAMLIMATMSWEEIAKGITGVAVGLVAISLAMQIMPAGSMIRNALAIFVVAGAMNLLALALDSFGQMTWEEIGKGLVVLGGSMLVLSLGLTAMSGAVAGAVALTIAAYGLSLLSEVIRELGGLSIGELVKGLIGIAGVLGALALGGLLLAPVIPAMLGLGAALLLIGTGFALFGLGAAAVGKAFEVIAKSGGAASKVVGDFLIGFAQGIPALVEAFAIGLLSLVDTLLAALPVVIKQFGVIVGELLKTFVKLLPEIGEAIKETILTIIDILRETVPEWIDLGFELLISFLTGIRDNIGEITVLVSEIITNFLDALTLEIPSIIDSVYNFTIAIIKGVASKMGDVGGYLLGKGVEFLLGLLEGAVQGAVDLASWFAELPGEIPGWIGIVGALLINKGYDILKGMLTGVENMAINLRNWFRDLPTSIKDWVGDTGSFLVAKGYNLIVGFFNGMVSFFNDKLIPYLRDFDDKVRDWVGDAATWLYEAGKDVIRGLWDGMLSMKDWIIGKAGSIVGWVTNPVTIGLDIFSPSRVFMGIGKYVGEGLGLGIESQESYLRRVSEGMANTIVDSFNPDVDDLEGKLRTLSAILSDSDLTIDADPVITPIVDLTNVNASASQISSIFGGLGARADVSLSAAQFIAASSISDDTSGVEQSSPGDVTFNQYNTSPKALTTADIYRNTRNQFAIAKEELDIPS